jgi:hypothetical protein
MEIIIGIGIFFVGWFIGGAMTFYFIDNPLYNMVREWLKEKRE